MSKAFFVVSINIGTGMISNAGIYSSNAAGLTSDGRTCFLDGPSAEGPTFAAAAEELKRTIHAVSIYRWMARYNLRV